MIDDARRIVAVFDLDGTVTRGDTFIAYLIHVLLHRPARLAYCLGLAPPLCQFLLGRCDNAELKRRFLAAVLGGCGRDAIALYTRSYVERRLDARIKPAARARIEWHRRQGHFLMLATASPDLYVGEIAERLGFDRAVCTRVAWHEGVVTGDLAGANLRGAAKLSAVQDALRAAAIDAPYVFAYSDHHSDVPLLDFADHAVAVDPTKKLAAWAMANDAAIEHWRRGEGAIPVAPPPRPSVAA